ncbi:hypothetical protein K470DRAFT_272276 [Piedraia hortae CBS 480.64]|uniref:NACHT domain-containing protein n=1 Tax=Piedraia hortae CBS 480.64 TaxID=1314780 RepID=A0A6A7BVU0_9PEZI|nr:hypothetical protein K470DRAFT_272276 [Piedraia hortae CBS 480.64]
MREIACQIIQFAPVFDEATNAQAEVLSLPWAGIRCLLMLAQKAHEQSESILKGIETVLDTSHLLNVYFDIYGQLGATPAIQHLYVNIVKLFGLILKFLARAQNTGDMNRLERLVHSLTGEVIPNFKATHDRMLETIEIHRRAVNDEVSKKQQTWVNKQLEALSKAQEEINQGVKGVQKTLDLGALRYAKRAAYDSRDYSSHSQDGDFQLCLDGTRVDITETIQKWATTDDEKRVFWLSGKAGTGKSTIARTVAHELAKQGYLVGSFFFKRGGGELSNAQYLFPTIARQMAYSIPSISDSIADASRDSPSDADSKSLENQFEMLIERPLLGYSTRSATDVRAIVIDALDECDARVAIGQAMTLWPRLGAHTSMNMRVFVTSRSDNEIWGTLGQLEPKYLRYERLEDWQPSTIENDLRRYCENELKKIREKRKNNLLPDELGDEWLGDGVVDRLVQISQPLFIAGSTILRDARNDPGRLQQRVNGLRSTGTKALTAIYLDILNQAAKFDNDWLDWFGQVIKPFALLHSSLTIPALADLLGGNTMVANALNPLSSVIEFPSGKEVKAGSRATVRAYHESLRDFLMDSSLKSHSPFWIDQGEVHGVLMSNCLDLLEKKLDRDVCKQKHPGTERKYVPVEDVKKHIPESVQYACRYWVSHAVQSKKTLEDGGQEDHFLRTCLLHWTEAMAWLEKLGELIICLKQLQKVIDSNFSPKLQSFVADALRWVPANRNMISDTPLQTYLSALAFAPSNSIVRNDFRFEMEDFLQVWPPVTADWDFELQTLRGHADQILSMALSIDGRKLVTIADDNTARVWDVESGTEEKCSQINLERVEPYTWKTHSVASAFSEEGLVAIAGLSGKFWRWNLDDDITLVVSKLLGVARSVSVAPNGRYAAWGLTTGEIYIWDAEHDSAQLLGGHYSPVWCMTFLSDSETLMSGSTNIWKWNAQTGHEEICQVGTVIRRIAISPDGNLVVFGSDIISVFHCTTHKVEQIMRGNGFSSLCSLIITPDSQKILILTECGLFLYDFRKQHKPIKLSLETSSILAIKLSPGGKTIWVGHISGLVTELDANLLMESQQQGTGVSLIALSADCRSLASLSQGNQLSLWNIETRSCEQRLSDERLLNIPESLRTLMLISPDSSFVVAAALNVPSNDTLLIWDLKSNELRELEDRPGHITALALSPDSKTLFCGSYDGQIWVVDVNSGVLREQFTVYMRRIDAIAVSPNGQKFASASDDKKVRIWGSKSQTPLILSSEHLVNETCFSADGRMLYICDIEDDICEWDIEKAWMVRKFPSEDQYVWGSILLNSRLVPSEFQPVMSRLAANEVDHPHTQANSLASIKSTPVFEGREL